MSVVSANSNVRTVTGGNYVAQNVAVEVVKGTPFDHMIPVITDLETKEGEPSNPSSEAKIKKLEDAGLKVQRLPISYKGKNGDEIHEQLLPFVIHYKMQLLLLSERTQRKVVSNGEMTSRSNIMTSFHFGIPLKEKILLQFSTLEARKLLGNTTESMNDEETVDFSATRHLAPEDLGVINDSIVNFESTVNKLLELTQTPGKSSK